MRGRLHIELRDAGGQLVATRDACNAVMRWGGELVARLFAGQGNPITHMGVGTSDAPETDAYNTKGLTNDPGAPLAGGTEVAIPTEAFTLTVDEQRRLVRVKVRATLPVTAGAGTIREAGLVSRSITGAVLYNRVTFAPLAKGADHELTLFWEVSFPYGDLGGAV